MSRKLRIRDKAQALIQADDRRAVPQLIRDLNTTKDLDVRRTAAYVLGFLHDRRAIRPLIQTLQRQKEQPGVRGQAAEALGYLSIRRAKPSAFSAVLGGLSDPSIEVRFWSAFALGLMGNRKAIPALRKIARNDKAVLRGWWSLAKESRDAIRTIESTPSRGAGRRKTRPRKASTAH